MAETENIIIKDTLDGLGDWARTLTAITSPMPFVWQAVAD